MHDPLRPPAVTVEDVDALFAGAAVAPQTGVFAASWEQLVSEYGPLTEEDIAEARKVEVGADVGGLKTIRHSHHRIAQMVAGGVLTNVEIGVLCNITPGRISILKTFPAFQELVEHYRAKQEDVLVAATAMFTDRAGELTLEMMQELQERLHNSPESFTPSALNELIKTLADRSGNAPVARSQNVNVNVNMGETLRAARERAVAFERQRQLPSPADVE